MHRVQAVVGLACLVFSTTVSGQTVVSKGGNIYFNPASPGELLRLTDSGLDREPNLSPDGEAVVFVRGTPGHTVESPTADEVEETELWTIRTDGTEPRLLLKGGAHKGSNEVPIAFFRSPQFSPDGTHVFFLSIAAVVTDAVFSVHIRTHELREVCAANSLLVVRKGEYAGDLVVEQHRYFTGGGSYDWVYLLEPDGKEIGPLGERGSPGFDLRLKKVLGGEDE